MHRIFGVVPVQFFEFSTVNVFLPFLTEQSLHLVVCESEKRLHVALCKEEFIQAEPLPAPTYPS